MHNRVMEVDQPMGAAMMFRKRVLEETGAFDPRFFLYMEEIDLCERIKGRGWKIYYLPQAQMIHHAGGSTNQDWERSQRQYFENVVRYFGKRMTGWKLKLSKCSLSAALVVRGAVQFLTGRFQKGRFYWKIAIRLFRF